MSDNEDKKNLKIDTKSLRDDAGKRSCDTKNKTQGSGVVCINEGLGIGIEFCELSEDNKKNTP